MLNDIFPGVMVTEVIPGSPAYEAGIRGANMTRQFDGEIVRLTGDSTVAVDGNTSVAKDNEAFVDYLQNEKSVGDNITLTFLRDGQMNEIDLTLGPLPTFFWYLDNDEGIIIQYPSDWRVSDSTLGPDDVIKFFSPEENPELSVQQRLQGMTKDDIDRANNISQGAVSNIIREWILKIGEYDAEVLLELAKGLKSSGLSPVECVNGLRVMV